MARILAGDRFKAGMLNDVLASMQVSSGPALKRSDLMRAEALIRLQVAEEAVGRKSTEEAAGAAASATDALKSSLAFHPTDSFSWLMLYVMQATRNGFDERTIGYLDQSYATGPLEGWIAVRRNKIGLAGLSIARATTQERVVLEFSGLIDSYFLENAATNFIGVGWQHRDRLLNALKDVDIAPREAFAKKLAREAIRVSVPGVELDERWWR